MKPGRLIGKGRTAEVYEWDEGWVLKLFYPHIPRGWVSYEAKVGSLVFDAGAPSPRVGGCVELGDRAGIIYERINGTTLLEHLMEKPQEGVLYAKQMAALHYRIHCSTCDELPRQGDRFSRAIMQAADILGEDKARTVMEYLDRLPNPSKICHGDFHPANLMLGRDLIPIDWMNVYSGAPCSDVARTCLMLRTPHVPQELSIVGQNGLIRLKQAIHDAYLEEYLRLSGSEPHEIEAWFLPVMAVRLREEVPGEREWLIAEVDQRLQCLGCSQ